MLMRQRDPVADNRSSDIRLRAGFDDVITAMVGDIAMMIINGDPFPRRYKFATAKGRRIWGVQSGGLNR